MSKKKPGEFPDWLFDPKNFPRGYVLWKCSGCGAPYYRLADTKFDQPIPLVGPCWRSQSYGVKCVTDKGPRVIYSTAFDYTIEPNEDIEPIDKWDHDQCASHFRHPAYRKRICVLPGQTIEEIKAFADEISELGRTRDEAKGTRDHLGAGTSTQPARVSAGT